MADEHEPLSPDVAFQQLRRVEERVSRKARREGWVWLTIAVATPVFLIVTHAEAAAGASFWVALGFCLVGGLLAVLDVRRPVVARESGRVARPATRGYVGVMVVVAALSIATEPVGPPAWFVLLALLTAVPCLYAAWVILRP